MSRAPPKPIPLHALAACGALGVLAAAAEDWPSWRGRDGAGVSAEAASGPTPGLETVAEIGMGEPIYSTPAVSGGRIYLRTWKRLYAIGK
ncbi:MAG: PQQ-binding-like beta-propeller repeat protein [Planctomycetes bacterium]|nr:PQQ-binding-like beta-propeller repeat protein [Planctomycetota bacterium]